jgi:hypothetical protein
MDEPIVVNGSSVPSRRDVRRATVAEVQSSLGRVAARRSKVTLHLDAEIARHLRACCAWTGQTLSQFVEQAIQSRLGRFKDLTIKFRSIGAVARDRAEDDAAA